MLIFPCVDDDLDLRDRICIAYIYTCGGYVSACDFVDKDLIGVDVLAVCLMQIFHGANEVLGNLRNINFGFISLHDCRSGRHQLIDRILHKRSLMGK